MLIEVNGEHVQASASACRMHMEGWNLGHYLPALAEQAQRQEYHTLSGFSQLLHAGMAAREFRADLVVETQARLLVALLHGLMVRWHRQPGSVDWRTVAEEIVRGLCAPSTNERPAETFVNEQKRSRGMREV